MPSVDLWSSVFGLAMLLIGAVVFAFSGRHVWRAITVRRATQSESIQSADPGTLRSLTGTVEPGDSGLLTAPFSGRDCVALRYAAEERRLTPAILLRFVTIHETAGSVAFRLRTAADVVDVDRSVRTVSLERDTIATVPADANPPDRVTQFERTVSGYPQTTRWRTPPAILRPLFTTLSLGTRRYTEQRATRGDTITIVGRVADAGIDPVVVSDATPATTASRMARTSLGGIAIGVGSVLLGALVLTL
ncbi:MAG: hypothetical protein ABEI27_09495 [Halobellus sp.]|uniref:hypothetical protein n=1 Tax=Halobellus sp. TaxID=1979212 RepID=UPI0035D43E9D